MELMINIKLEWQQRVTHRKKEQTIKIITLVAKMNVIRMMIALKTKHNWKLNQLDVKSAFLNGEVKEVYLVQS